MAQAPIWPVATDAIIADTMHLNAEEFGAYVMLMVCQWRLNGEGLPDNMVDLQRMSRVPSRKWKKVWPRIEHLFPLENGLRYNSRVRKDLLRVLTKVQANRENAARGGRAKALKYKDMGLADATKTLERNSSDGGSETLPIHEPLTIKKKKKDNKEKEFGELFEERIWGICPKKVACGKVKRKFISLCKHTDSETIIAGWEKAVAYWKASDTERQFIPNPLTWFNEERWTDEYEPVKSEYAKQWDGMV